MWYNNVNKHKQEQGKVMEAQTINSSSEQTVCPAKKANIPAIILGVTTLIATGIAVFLGVQSLTSKSLDTESVSPSAYVPANSTAIDPYVSRDLRNKTLRLLGWRNGLGSYDDYNQSDGTFLIYSDYMPTAGLVGNSLTDVQKVYITLETTTMDEEKYCNYEWTDGVKGDIDSIVQRSDIYFGSENIDCISYKNASADYFDLFGGVLPKLTDYNKQTLTGGDLGYGANLDAYYYHIIGGRGGTSSWYIAGKNTGIVENDDNAYVDIKGGTVIAGWSVNGYGVEIYSSLLHNDEESFKSINVADRNEMDNIMQHLAEYVDYDVFQAYRFVFEKNSDGIYSFVRVETL